MDVIALILGGLTGYIVWSAVFSWRDKRRERQIRELLEPYDYEIVRLSKIVDALRKNEG